MSRTPATLSGCNSNPQAGHEQSGHRPAVVLSPARYNGKTGLMVCCPTTTRIKNYPFEVPIAGDPPSVALADQLKSVDWRARRQIQAQNRRAGIGGNPQQSDGAARGTLGCRQVIISATTLHRSFGPRRNSARGATEALNSSSCRHRH
jgi:mRNA-degrading endonuclease toxin of MazEF toxin-antitoxin module